MNAKKNCESSTREVFEKKDSTRAHKEDNL